MDFAIRNNLVKKLSSLPREVNDGHMVLKLPLPAKKQATVISVYVPTLTNPNDAKEKF